MGFNNLLRSSRFLNALIIFSALCALILINGIFALGGASFFDVSTTLLSPAAAVAACFFFFRAMVVVKDPRFRHLWLWMGIAFALWGIAEVIWAVFSLAINEEMPPVTIADLFWIIGYIPLYLAFFIRQRTFAAEMTPAQKWWIRIISLILFVFTFYVAILPILQNFDPQAWLEGLVYLCYPVGDLGLVIMSCIALILLRGGRYSLSWRLIFTGLFVMAFSDILYNYAVWNDLYYPENQVNFLSSLIDTTYILSYLLVGFGAYVYGLLWRIKDKPDMRVSLIPSTRYHAFVGTNRENHIIATSENFHWLINAKSDTPFYRLSLAEALGIDLRTAQVLTDKIIDQGTVYQEEVSIFTQDKKKRTVQLSALATNDTENQFAGINLVFQGDFPTPADLQMPKSRDLQAITRHVLNTTSARLKEEDQALRLYFLESLRTLFSVLFQFGGEHHKNDLVAEINNTLQQKNLLAGLNDEGLAISEDYEGEELSIILSDLLQAAQNQVSRIVGEQVVREKMDEFEQEVSPSLPKALDRNRLNMSAAQSG